MAEGDTILRAASTAPAIARLGEDFDAALVAHSLRAAPDLAIGDALLNQTLVAGIGNILKSEACFAARRIPGSRSP